MRRMTCKNGFIFVAAICLGLMVTSARGGSLDAPAAPTDPASAMFTLNDIYNKLDTRAAVTKRTGGFTEPSGWPTNGTMRTLNAIMTLVTNRTPVAKTGQKISYAPYDDGWYSTNVGVAWPNPRFTIGTGTDGTNCVTDNLTGLIWARNANIFGATIWSNALSSCNTLNYGGHTDWRLSNEKELFSLLDMEFLNDGPQICNTAGTAQWTEGDPFTGLLNATYWSSTEYHDGIANPMGLSIADGTWYYRTMTDTYYVWPVRGGQ